jgi:hypothetical protein
MPKKIYDALYGGPLVPLNFFIQMVDQTSRCPEGMAKDTMVRIQDKCVPADFVILDIGRPEGISLLLERPFLNTANATIYVGAGHVKFRIEGKILKCPFTGYNKNKTTKKNQTKGLHTQHTIFSAGWTTEEGAMFNDSHKVWA